MRFANAQPYRMSQLNSLMHGLPYPAMPCHQQFMPPASPPACTRSSSPSWHASTARTCAGGCGGWREGAWAAGLRKESCRWCCLLDHATNSPSSRA